MIVVEVLTNESVEVWKRLRLGTYSGGVGVQKKGCCVKMGSAVIIECGR